jgi:hypothetical protein
MTCVARCDIHAVLPEGTRRAGVQLPTWRTLETRHLESDDFVLCWDGFDDSEIALELSKGD